VSAGNRRHEQIRRIGLSAWGMATVVLAFTVVFLVYVMAQGGPDPLTLVKEQRQLAPPPPVAKAPEAPVAMVDATLYFADPSGRGLVPETRQFEYGDHTVENCRNALEALIRGPSGALSPILPGETDVRGLYLLEDGELVIDFAIALEMELKGRKSALIEALMAQGLANTLTQSALRGADGASVTCVRLLIEGARPRESFPAHLDASVPIVPDPEWLAGPQEPT